MTSVIAGPVVESLLSFAAMSDERFDRRNVEAQIEDLKKQIAELLKKIETAVGREVENLGPKLKAAQEKLEELSQTSAAAWGDLKPGLEKSWQELHKSLSQAASRFRARTKQ